MRVVYPEPDHPFDRARIAPLQQVAKALATSTRLVDARFDPDDFMDLSWCRQDRPPGIKVFKHVLTRQYLYLDEGGRAYRYVVDRPGDLGGRYRPHARLSDAIDNLQLAAGLEGVPP